MKVKLTSKINYNKNFLPFPKLKLYDIFIKHDFDKKHKVYMKISDSQYIEIVTKEVFDNKYQYDCLTRVRMKKLEL